MPISTDQLRKKAEAEATAQKLLAVFADIGNPDSIPLDDQSV